MTGRIPESEAGLQAAVIQAARLHGWAVAHFGSATTASGRHMTPTRADAAGFPDLVLVGSRVLFREVKTDTGTLSPAQREWGAGLIVAGADWDVWRPRDWDNIIHELGGKGA